MCTTVKNAIIQWLLEGVITERIRILAILALENKKRL